jgi:hypothetical protein
MGERAREAAVVAGAMALCPLAALLIGDDPTAAAHRAHALAGVERDLGVHVEPAVVGWAAAHPALLSVATAFYLLAHVPVTGWALIWTWCLRRDSFARVRTIFVGTQVALAALYVLVPTLPPRLADGVGGAASTPGWAAGVTASSHVVQSPFAAMPSGHVAFALVAGGTFALLGDRRWLRAFGWAYPVVVVAVTILTGHHLIVDAVAAASLVGGVTAVTVAAPATRHAAREAWARRPGWAPSAGAAADPWNP